MPRCKSSASLQQLCLQIVGKKMDFWCGDFVKQFKSMKDFKYFIGPFDDLSSDVSKDLMLHLMRTRNLKQPYLYMLINYSLLELDLSGCPMIVKDNIMSVILSRCKSLKSINLTNCYRIKKSSIIALSEGLPNLTSLNLTGTKCEKEAAVAVFNNCTKVHELVLSCCMLGDEDLSVLISSVESKGTHRNLRKLSLYSTNVSTEGLLSILRSLPWVTLVEHRDMLQCLCSVNDSGRNERGKVFQLTSLMIQEAVFATSNMLTQCFRLCPQLVKIEIIGVRGYDNRGIQALGDLKQLSDLKLVCDHEYEVDFYGGLVPVLEKIGANLHRLVLQDIEDLNPLKTAYLCPNLQELYLSIFSSQISYDTQIDDSSDSVVLKKLKKLTLEGDANSPSITGPMLFTLLKGCLYVQDVTFIQLKSLTDAVLQQVLEVNDLSHVTDLSFHQCSSIRESIVNQLILFPANQLCRIELMNCWNITRQHYSQWLKVIAHNNYDLVIDWN